MEDGSPLLHFDESIASIGARGSLGRAELASMLLHRRTSGDWRMTDCYNHIQEGDLHKTKRHLPPAWGATSYRTTDMALRPWKEIAESLKCSIAAKQ